MRKQFDLEYYIEHPKTKVVTRDDHSVRIICTDAISEESYNIVGLVSCGSRESVYRFKNNGMYMDGCEHYYDLFFYIPDQEMKRVPLTYEDLLERVKDGKTMWIFASSNICEEIVFFTTDIVDTGYRSTVYELLKDAEFHFADGTPCWKEVRNEGK